MTLAKFLIQTIDGEIPFDFAFHLKEAVKYNNWFYNEKVHEYVFLEDIDGLYASDAKDYIPIGSVDFVLSYYKKHCNISVEPINIPKELNKYEFLQRKVFEGDKIDEICSDPNKYFFIKDISGFKKTTDILPCKHIPRDKKILVSEKIDILSEFRCFVYNKRLLDVKGYINDSFLYPDINIIKRMIEAYTNSPRAYTLDVAISSNMKTVLIEVHQFFSCGLYGFADYRFLCNMFISTHREILESK